ncbi:MAG: hypothetical protein HY796_08770 [Elusimicrobia bacterium]|nr:hypothetical protein [Elusimicrobiota bacterium]
MAEFIKKGLIFMLGLSSAIVSSSGSAQDAGGPGADFYKLERPNNSKRLYGGNHHRFLPRLKISGPHIYYVWAESDGSYYHIWTGRSRLDGTGFTSAKRTNNTYDSHEPALDVYKNKAYFVYQEYDGSHWQIWTANAGLAGAGWTAVRQTSGAFDKFHPKIDVYDGRIYYVFFGKDPGTDWWQIYTAVSDLDGANFVATRQTRTSFPYGNFDPYLEVDAAKVRYVYSYYDGSYYQIKTAYAGHDGAGWTATLQTAGVYDKFQNQGLDVEDGRVYYTWYEWYGPKWSIWTARSNLDGSGFTPVKQTFTDHAVLNPKVKADADAGKAYYVWQEKDADSAYQIWTATAGLDGADWKATRQTTGGYSKTQPFIDTRGGHVYYSYSGYKGAAGAGQGNYQLHWARTDLDGAGWRTAEKTFTGPPDVQDAFYPQLQVVENKIYYVFSRSDGVNQQIWTGRSDLDGSYVFLTSQTASAVDKWNPQLQVYGSRIYYAWHEKRGIIHVVKTARSNLDGSGWADETCQTEVDSFAPKLKVYGDKIYYAWCQYTGPYYDIYFVRTELDGSNKTLLHWTSARYYKSHPQFDIKNGRLYFAYLHYDETTQKQQVRTGSMNIDGTDYVDAMQTSSNYEKYKTGDWEYGEHLGIAVSTANSRICYTWQQKDDNGIWQIHAGLTGLDNTGWMEKQLTATGYKFDKLHPRIAVAEPVSEAYYTWQEFDGYAQSIWVGKSGLDLSGFVAFRKTNDIENNVLPQFQIVGSTVYFTWNETDEVRYLVSTGRLGMEDALKASPRDYKAWQLKNKGEKAKKGVARAGSERMSATPADKVLAQACYNRGLAAYLQGRLKESVMEWAKAANLDPDDDKVRKALERVRKELGTDPAGEK